MMQALLLITALTASAQTQKSPIQSKNGEFIFRHYPARAKAAGEQGSVRFQAEVDAKGNVMSCKVTVTSGHDQLDRETCDLIVDHASFNPTLDSDGKAREAIHDGVVNWRIPDRTPPEAKVASIGGKSPEEVVCKRSLKTGSLVAHSRLCLTRREWVQRAETTQAEWGDDQRRGWAICGEYPYPAC
jgi:TonB family protein